MFWKHLRGVRDEFANRGATHQERIDKIVEAVLRAPPDVQKEMLKSLRDVGEIANSARTLLLALLPPDVTNGNSRKNAG